MLIYFHETKFPCPVAPDAPPAPWVAYWARVPNVNIDSEQVLQTQGSSTPSVDAASNTRAPLALSLPSSIQEELMKDDFIYVPPQEETQQTSNNDCPQEAEKQGVTVSLTSSVIEDLMKDNYVYEVSNEEPLEQPCEEPIVQESKQEAPVDVCPPEPNKQGVTGSITISDEEQSKEPLVARQSEKETLIFAAQPREREDERPSFSLGISPPVSQPTQLSQESDSQLEILVETVVDAGVEAALKFTEGTSSEQTLPAAQVYKTPQKKTEITNELIEKCYHWMTHVK
ncbi:hypothetical protein AHAS_Ahas20G0163800 [Arachis hypogaea]